MIGCVTLTPSSPCRECPAEGRAGPRWSPISSSTAFSRRVARAFLEQPDHRARLRDGSRGAAVYRAGGRQMSVGQYSAMASQIPLREPVISVQGDDSPEFLGCVRLLFKEYASSLGAAVRLREFMQELTHLPGEYAAPKGALLVAFVDGNPAGCVAVRPLDDDGCEMRRLWVRHPFRSKGVGRSLSLAAIEHARAQRYRVVRLHTAPWMSQAMELNRSLGFVIVPPYRETLIQGATFMELVLA